MIEGSSMFARLIVQHHMPAAQAALLPYKNLKHPKIKLELDALLAAWTTMQEGAKRDESLTKMQTKIKERTDQINQMIVQQQQPREPSQDSKGGKKKKLSSL